MALLDDIKKSLRLTTTALDAEVEMLAESALYDMERAGVNPVLLEVDKETGDLPNRFVKQAVTTWCKAHFGYDVNTEAYRFEAAYDRILNSLLNSSENIAAIDGEPEPETEPEPEPEPDTEPDEGGE